MVVFVLNRSSLLRHIVRIATGTARGAGAAGLHWTCVDAICWDTANDQLRTWKDERAPTCRPSLLLASAIAAVCVPIATSVRGRPRTGATPCAPSYVAARGLAAIPAPIVGCIECTSCRRSLPVSSDFEDVALRYPAVRYAASDVAGIAAIVRSPMRLAGLR